MSSDWKSKVIETFGAKAGSYHQHSDLQDKIAETLVGHLPQITNANILEIGCGTGRLTEKLFELYPDARFHITDVNPNMVQQAQMRVQKNASVRWGVMDGEAIDVTQKYDLIVSNMAFQWFERPQQSLGHLKNALTSSGQLFYTVPSRHSFKEWRAVLSELSLPYNIFSEFNWPDIFSAQDIAMDYGNTLTFLRSLRETGANVPGRHYSMLKASELRKACLATDQKYNGQITWHILYGCITCTDASK